MKTNQLLFSKVRKGIYSLALVSVIVGGLAGCSKDDDDDDTQTTPTASTVPPINDADAALVALNTITTTTTPAGPFEITLGTGVAVFPTTAGGSTYADAGAVTLEGEALSKQTNNSYVYTPTATNATGLDLSGSIGWTVAGAGSVPAINHTVGVSFPTLGVITSDTSTLSSSSDFTLSVASVANADSVIFQLAGQDGYKLYTRGPGTTSFTYTASDVASVGSGYAVIQVAAYTWESEMVGGKKVYYINETVRSIVVTID
jgi:hypothetical protein